MLELKNITKIYEIGREKDKNYLRVEALKGISIKFRKSEFVSILGQSGCGKTTLLNIVGGLDKYTSGDLIINGKSTKHFNDKEWDSYRNHSIGFVFQSYNLIPHQTVLQNVELALTLSGINRSERRKRAEEVLTKVGLADKINAKPNQLSGGQMQRVAIARALVNNPDVILADEPTGALDSKTSVQIMELLKEISNEKLIIMVTHNPEIAEKYSTRIIKLKDGELVDDSNPVVEEYVSNGVIGEIGKKKNMSFRQALSLSFNNLFTKKARTLLVSIAGSIGIIGIALILALSTGFQMYIDKTQEDTLSSYPVTISSVNTDVFGLMMSIFTSEKQEPHPDDGVYAGDTMNGLFEQASSQLSKINDLKAFSNYIEKNRDKLDGAISDVQYTYNFNLSATTSKGVVVRPKSSALYEMILMYSCSYLENEYSVSLKETSPHMYTLSVTDNTTEEGASFMAQYLSEVENNSFTQNGSVILSEQRIVSIISKAMGLPIASYASADFKLFSEMINNEKLLKSQYELVGNNSRWASGEDEVMLVLGDNNELDDYYLYTLRLIGSDEMKAHMDALFKDATPQMKLEYDEIIGTKYRVFTESDYFYYDDELSKWVDIRTLSGDAYTQKYNQLIANDSIGKTVRITGIVRLNEATKNGQLSTGIVYTKALTDSLIQSHNNSQVVKSQEEGVPSAVDLTPATINFYASSFEAKETIENFIKEYNEQAEESKQIEYTDYVGLLMSSVSTIISAITYILVGFVSVSLVVSSIMIGVITYISVLERIKEIGILRAVGASKRDIRRVFSAETIIIGFASGLIGVLVTWLFTIPINIVLKNLTEISNVASLPFYYAIILVAISVFLTFIAGLIPSRIASKKDPVVALRSE